MVAGCPAKARHLINPTPDTEIDLVRGFMAAPEVLPVGREDHIGAGDR
jgi:hypothetical protein